MRLSPTDRGPAGSGCDPADSMGSDAVAVNTSPRPAGLEESPVYLDYNATTPVDVRVAEAMRPYWAEHFGNPSSAHHYGKHPMHALVTAREQVANLIGARAGHIVFTASGSEANLLALRGVLVSRGLSRPHVITQATEHPAVLETCRALERLHGVRVTVLPVERSGVLDAHRLEMAMTADTVLVSVMAANNETGTLQPVAKLASIAHRHGALFHCDAAQACAKIPVDVSGWGADLLTVVGHKMYAPKGIGALYVGPGLRLEPAIYGGGQEHGLRAGTENVALAVALGAAADLAAGELRAGQPAYLAALARPPAPAAGTGAPRPYSPQRAPDGTSAQHLERQHRRHHRQPTTRRRSSGRSLYGVGLPRRYPYALSRAHGHGRAGRPGAWGSPPQPGSLEHIS